MPAQKNTHRKEPAMNLMCAARARLLTVSLALTFLLSAAASASLSNHDVLLVINDQSPVSVAIGNYYKVVRDIPEINVCHLTACPTNESVGVDTWYDQVRTPIWNYLNDPTHPWLQDQIKVILLTKGVPLRFWADYSRDSSVDMPLCYLGNSCAAGTEPIGHFVQDNRYFAQDQAFESFRDSTTNEYPTAFPYLYEVHGFDTGSTVVCGSNGVMLRSVDGSSWSPISEKDRAFSGTTLNCITHVGNYGWATQDNGRILKSTNGGVSWSCVRGSSTSTALKSISFADANTGWAVGWQVDHALLLSTVNGGSWGTWQPVDLSSLSLPNSDLTGVCAIGTDAVVACGISGVVIKGVKSGGNWTWSRIINVPSNSYNAIAMRQSTGWIVGSGGKILKTTDSGSTWQEQNSNTALSLNRIYALDQNYAWATTGLSTLLRTTDGGTTWNVISLQLGQNLQSVCFTDANNGLAVGNNMVFASTDGGATWSAVFTGQETAWRENYLVCRLDGYQYPADSTGLPVDIKRIIDDAAHPDSSGCFVLDKSLGNYPQGEYWMDSAFSQLTSMGVEAAIDSTYTFLTNVHSGSQIGGHTLSSDVMGYCSWGSNDGNSYLNTLWARPLNTWCRGSISTTHVSTSGRTFNSPPDLVNCTSTLSSSSAPQGIMRITGCWSGWSGILHDNYSGEDMHAVATGSTMNFQISHNVADGYVKLYYADGTEISSAKIETSAGKPIGPTRLYGIGQNPFMQSLVADLIHEGCSATIGNVAEPYLDACGQPQYLFPRYVDGFQWAECAYMSMEWASWREVAVGDPLMAAYTTPPVVTLDSPNTDGAVISGTAYAISATATPVNAPGINRVEFWLSDGDNIDALIGTATAAPYSITFNTTTLPAPYSQAIPDGRYVIEAVAYEDTNVRETGRAARPVVINNGGSPAVVNITNPATDGTVLANTATISIAATPSGPPEVATIDVWLHGASRHMLIGTLSAPGNLSFDTTNVPDGAYSIQAVAYSTTGQASASTARQVIVDNSSLIQITDPATDGETKSGTFSVSTSCAASVSRVDFWFAQGSSTGTLIVSDTSSPFSCSVDSTTFANGNYTIRALAYTAGGSQAVNTAVRTVVINNTPLLTFTIPTTDGQTLSGLACIQVTAGATDPAIDHVDLWPYGNAGYAILSSDATSPFNWSLDTTTLTNGSYTLRAAAYKAGGGQVAYTPTRTITVNNGNLLSVDAPATDGTSVSGTTTLVIGAQTTTPDIARVDIHFTGKNTSEQVWSVTGRPFEYALDTTSYADGFYTITVYAFKSDGRKVMNSSATRQFTINNSHPAYGISAARALTDSSPCMLEGKVVSVGNSAAQSAMENAIYVEEPNRSAGVRVAWSYSTIPAGKQVTILGTVSNMTRLVNGVEVPTERQIVAEDIWVGPDASPAVAPLGMIGKAVGGVPPASETYTNGVTDGVGLYNTGLLTKIWGRVVYAASDYIYLDDGSGPQDGNNLQYPEIVPLVGGDRIDRGIGVKGLRVYFGNITKPGIDDYVALTGISSLEMIGSNRVAMIRARSADNVTYSDQYIPAKIVLNGIARVDNSDLLPAGTKVRLVDKIVENIFTWQGSTSIWIREQSGLNVVIAIPTQLQPGLTLDLSTGDTITVTGTIMSARSLQGFWQVDASAGHVYWGGSTYGAMSVRPSAASTSETLCAASSPSRDGRSGGGPFRPWPGPTIEEILCSERFRLNYNQVGAIGWALSQPDGSIIDLPAEDICGEWYDGQVFGLRESFEPIVSGPRLFLYLDRPIKLDTRFRDMGTIDIIGGKLVTLKDGIRAIVKPEAVYVYTDATGQWMFPLPWPKFAGRDAVTNGSDNWPWKLKVAP
ncbi:MAG: TIGR03790 family protein [Armatimonadota bacterium]